MEFTRPLYVCLWLGLMYGNIITENHWWCVRPGHSCSPLGQAHPDPPGNYTLGRHHHHPLLREKREGGGSERDRKTVILNCLKVKVYGLRVKGLSTHTTITSEDETGKMRQSGGDKQEQSSGGKSQNEQNMTEQREQLNQQHTHLP